MQNQPERLISRGTELQRTELDRHRRHQALVQMAVSDPEINLTPILCHCNAFSWVHVKHLSTRCHG